MKEQVRVQIHNVNYFEIMKFNDLIRALTNRHYHTDVLQTDNGKDYIITVVSETNDEIRKVLDQLLQSVEPERVSINT